MSNKEKTRQPDTDKPADQPEDGAAAAGDESGAPVNDATVNDAKADAEAAESELTLEEQLAEMTDRWIRTRADTENARRRARLDVEEARKHGASGLIQSLLPVLDSLQRALATRPDSDAVTASGDSNDKVWEGLELTEQMLVGTLAAHGVTPIDASVGAPFDPTAHRALLEQPTDEQEPGTVVMELVRGYRLHDRLLREAQVTVATRPVPTTDGGPPDVSGQDDADDPAGEDIPDADL